MWLKCSYDRDFSPPVSPSLFIPKVDVDILKYCNFLSVLFYTVFDETFLNTVTFYLYFFIPIIMTPSVY